MFLGKGWATVVRVRLSDAGVAEGKERAAGFRVGRFVGRLVKNRKASC